MQMQFAHSKFESFANLLNSVNLSKDSYFEQKETAEKSDIRIEESMLAFDRGEIDVERVQ